MRCLFYGKKRECTKYFVQKATIFRIQSSSSPIEIRDLQAAPNWAFLALINVKIFFMADSVALSKKNMPNPESKRLKRQAIFPWVVILCTCGIHRVKERRKVGTHYGQYHESTIK